MMSSKAPPMASVKINEPGDERHAEHDRERGEQQAHLAGEQVAPGHPPHVSRPRPAARARGRELLHLVEHLLAVGSRSSSTISPSARKTTRSVYAAATGSWVTITMVWPWSSTLRRSSSSTSAPDVESRLPVGSSAKTIVRPAHQRPGHRDPLLLAAGELVGPVVEPVARGRRCR